MKSDLDDVLNAWADKAMVYMVRPNRPTSFCKNGALLSYHDGTSVTGPYIKACIIPAEGIYMKFSSLSTIGSKGFQTPH